MSAEVESQVPMTLEPVASPERVTANGLKAVTHLMKILDEKPNKVMINNKRHIEFDDWVLLGQLYGVDVETGEAEPVEVFEVKGFKAKAIVIDIKTGKKVGGASAYCMSNEPNWRNKPFFQLASMAQTRAGSKALANILRGFVALKGISGTPAEEMMMNGQGRNNQSKRKPANAKKPAPPKADPTEDEVNNIIDAEFEKKPQKPAKKDEPETMDMTQGDRVNLTELLGINEELDKYIHMAEDVGATAKEVYNECEELLGKQQLTPTEMKKVKEAIGMPVE